jgi:hypothetical protein
MAKIPEVHAPEPLVKQPSEVWPFTMPFARVLGAQTIAALAEVRFFLGTYPDAAQTTAIADPENPDPGQLTLDASDFDDTHVELTLSGGAHGEDYYLEIDVTTDGGFTRSLDGWLLVRNKPSASA